MTNKKEKQKDDAMGKINGFLEYLNENYSNPDKRTKAKLEKNFSTNFTFSDVYSYCISRRLIEYEKIDKRGNYRLKLSLEGLEFLDRQKDYFMSRKSHKATIIIALATALNVFVYLFNFVYNIENKNWVTPLALGVIGVFIVFSVMGLVKELIEFFQK